MKTTFPAENDEDKLFIARIHDLIALSEKHNALKFTTFLNERQKSLIVRTIGKSAEYMFFGGYDEAVRCVCAIYHNHLGLSADEQAFSIAPVTFKFNQKSFGKNKLTHKDFLGALTSLNIKRELIGDILVSEDYAVVFTLNPVSDIILSEVTKIGATGVTPIVGLVYDLPGQGFTEIKGTVQSLRADCVVALLTKFSRDKAAALIKSGKVFVNDSECCDKSEVIKVNDIISIRGFGKYIFAETGGTTKKQRIHVVIKKYM